MPKKPDPGIGRYIVRARQAERLVEFIDDIRNDPDMELVDMIGPAGQPHTAVVLMSDDTARTLQQRFHATHQLTIEPDRPLSLFGGV